jgi:hypothetical protein
MGVFHLAMNQFTPVSGLLDSGIDSLSYLDLVHCIH